MNTLRKATDGLTRVLDAVCGAGMLLLFLMTCVAVVLRYVFNSSIYGLSEISNYLFVYLTAVGSAVAIRSDEHVGVDFFARSSNGVKTAVRVFRLAVMAVVQGFVTVLSLQWIGKVGGYLTPLLRFPQGWAQVAVPIGMGLSVLMCVLCMILGYAYNEEKEMQGL